LRTPTTIFVNSDSSAVKWVPDEIGSGDSSVVKPSSNSKSHLCAVKTSQDSKYAKLIERETSILKTLKHPLILKLERYISDAPDHNSAIETEFAGNGSLGSYLPPTECSLSGSNRITKIVVGIALAMRFVHSRNIIHRDLKPDNILLDWDWRVRIADFGQSISLDNPAIPSLTHPNAIASWPSIDSRYLAPECYNNEYFQESDVFSFGLIAYELLTGQSAFRKDLTKPQIAFILVMTEERPEIPKFVLPSAGKLITECWAKEPGDRPSFEDIVDRLAKMKFKILPNVNSAKISAFFREIQEWEADVQHE
jgi:serine/threonine protein kinase